MQESVTRSDGVSLASSVEDLGKSIHKTDWYAVVFFVAITLLAVIGAPAYIFFYGLPSAGILALSLFYLVASGLSITAGYHRLFAHRTYKANVLVRFFFLF